MRDVSTQKLNLATNIFHVDSFVVLFSSFFLLCGDLKFDLMFFIQIIWWIRTHQIFKNLIKQNISNVAVCLIKSIWFIKDSFGKHLLKPVFQSIFSFLRYPLLFFPKAFFFNVPLSLNSCCLSWFSRAVIFWAPCFSNVG